MFGCNWSTMFGGGGGYMGGGLFGMLWSVLLLGLVIYLGVRLFQGLTGSANARRDRDDSLGILREKFARGEISSKEYERTRDLLSH